MPGEILSVSCSEAYPTLGQPVHLLITLQGKAPERFNQTLTITDEFSGFVMTDGEMKWISGIVTISQTSITIGKLPRYTRKIPWYPSVVGNHTFHMSVAASPEKELNISVSFDVKGIITPSLGCPSVIIKNTSDQLSVTLSEERAITEESCQVLQLQFDDIHSTSSYLLFNYTETVRTYVNAEKEVVEDDLILTYNTSSIPKGFYNLSVRTTKQNYSWPHAVKFLDAEPSEYTIVQLSDIHIGKYSNFVNKKNELIRLLTYLNEQIGTTRNTNATYTQIFKKPCSQVKHLSIRLPGTMNAMVTAFFSCTSPSPILPHIIVSLIRSVITHLAMDM